MKICESKIHALTFFLLIALLFTSCENPNEIQSTDTAETTVSAENSQNITAITPYELSEEDTNAEWDGNETSVTFSGSSAVISGGNASFSGNVLTIKKAGTYILTGTLDNGQVLIDADKDEIVRLILNNVSVHNETGPAVYAPQSEKVVLVLADETNNNLSDGGGYTVDENSDDPNAAVYVQDDLSITGNGTLNITGTLKHGIRTQDMLTITSGTINVAAAGDALRGRDGITILDGVLNLNAGGDGIQSNNDKDEAKGFITVNGGSFTIKADNDGIQAETSLIVNGGSFNIITGGGSANAPVQEENFPGNQGGFWGGEQTATQATDNSVSMKALKAGNQLTISGGEFIIDAEDDAVHSNNTVLITGGTFAIKTGDDGFHADAAMEIRGGDIDILICYEGIEGISVTISGGNISITASDDAINAAGGADSSSQFGGPMGRDNFSVSGDIFIRISGGTVDLYAPNDGIDSNGNVYIEGGTTKTSGPSQGMEGAIDLDGALTITGGELITAGSIVSVSQDTTQPVLLVSYTSQIFSGSVIEIKDASNNTLLDYTSKTACSLSGFTSPSFKVGETYSLFINGEKRADIILGSTITSIGENGGSYSGSASMNGRGNMGGRGMR